MNTKVLAQSALGSLAVAALVLSVGVDGFSQRGGGGAPPSGREAAPIDLTGYWTAIVDEDWRHRMFTAQRGDYQLMPLNAEGRRMADAWTGEVPPSGDDCLMAYGAAGIMRLPGHLNITWADDNTLQIDLDAGTQTRRYYFGEAEAPAGQPTLQGYSVAEWEVVGGVTGRGQGVSLNDVPLGGSMKSVTTNLLPGYYLKNGIPYSGDALMTEYFVRISEPDGNEYLLVQTYVEDPTYLTQQYVRTLTFKKLLDGSLWNPTPCSEY